MNKQKKAFTLVELIVVITILAILGTIAFISMQGYSASSRDSVRISDTGNMKTALELFHLNAGKYPLPDNYTTVQYSGDALFYQGIFGTNVIQNVSRTISKIPKDPLTESEYIYSISNNKNEMEILSLLESDNYTMNIVEKSNAAGITVTPKIIGNYNGLFIKTATYIVPLPSIINTVATSGTLLALDSENIKSMVTDLGSNIPSGQGNITTSTGNLTNLVLVGVLNNLTKDSTNIEKALVIEAIKSAYINESQLNQDGVIKYISNLSADSVTLSSTFNDLVLNITPPREELFICGTSTVSAGGYTYTTIEGLDGNCRTNQNMKHGTMLSNGVNMPILGNTIEKWCSGSDLSICNTNGGLYTWAEAMGFDSICNTTDCSLQSENTIKSVCGQLGEGWSIPTDVQLIALVDAGATGWLGNKLGGIMSALTGYRADNGSITNAAGGQYLWSATQFNEINSRNRHLYDAELTDTYNGVTSLYGSKLYGFSVMCVKK